MARHLTWVVLFSTVLISCGKMEEGAMEEPSIAHMEETNERIFDEFVESIPLAPPEEVYLPCLQGLTWKDIGPPTFSPDSEGFLPSLEELIDVPIRIGETRILEMSSTLADGSGAMATCSNDRPTILYAPWLLKDMSKYSFPFVRHHEVAHHSLGHVRCPCRPTVASPKLEQEADCESARELVRTYADGRWLAITGSDRLRGLQPDPDHGAGNSRADYVQRNCLP